MELPNGWITTSLFEIGELVKGVSYKKDEARKVDQPDHLPILRANNIQECLGFDDLVFVPRKRIKDEQLIKAGDIILALSSGSKNLVGKAAQAKENYEIAFGTFCGLIRFNKLVNNSLFGYYFQSQDYRNIISELSSGVNINNLRREHLEQLNLFLPPVSEQHRIVAKLEELFTKLDVSVTELKKAKAQIKRYRQSVLKSAFEGKLTEEWRTNNEYSLEQLLERLNELRKTEFNSLALKERRIKKINFIDYIKEDFFELPTLPINWFWSSLDSFTSLKKNSIKAGPFGSALKKETYVEKGYKIYGQEQVIRGDVSYGDYFINEFKYEELKSCAVKPYDVLISLVGTIGKVLILPNVIEEGVINPRLVKLSLNQDLMIPTYFKYYFESEFAKSLYALQSHGATMDILNLKIITELPFPICNVDEQIQIVSEIERHFSVADATEKIIDQSLKQAERLRQSILKDAFTGKLVQQDPNDPPASLLLEKIKEERAKLNKESKPRRRTSEPAEKLLERIKAEKAKVNGDKRKTMKYK